MYLELRPVSRPAPYGPEWDAYGLCDNQQWLTAEPREGLPDVNLPDRSEIARQFLASDPFHDRGAGSFLEDAIVRDGQKFLVFLLSQPAEPSGDPRPPAQTIFIPPPETRDGRFVWLT